MSHLFRLLAVALVALVAARAHAQPVSFTLDFESGDLSGWTKTGTVFDFQPTVGDNPTARHRGQPSAHAGSWWIGGYEKYQGRAGQNPGDIQGDEPTGTLFSAPFTVTGNTLSFLIGGGRGHGTRIEFVVGNIPVLRSSGKDTETMDRVTWDLTPFRGKKAYLRIIDEASGGWGHINIDDFRFDDGGEPAALADLSGVWNCNDGGKYYIRQLGDQVWWYGESAGSGRAWSNVFQGRREGNQVSGAWADVPKGGARSSGEMVLNIIGTRLVAANRTGGFGGSQWTR